MDDLRDVLVKMAKDLPETRQHILPLLRTAMEFPTEDARKEYLKKHPKADPKRHTVKQQGAGGGDAGGAKTDEPKDAPDKKPAAPAKPRRLKTQKDHDERYKDPSYKTERIPGYHPQKVPPGYKPNPKARALIPKEMDEFYDLMPDKDMEAEEAYRHPAISKLMKYLRSTHTHDEMDELYTATQGALGKFMDLLHASKTDAEADAVRFPMRRNYALWRAVNFAQQEPAPKKMKDKSVGRPGGKKDEGEKDKPSKKKHAPAVQKVMDKHDLTDDDADEVRAFKKSKPTRGKVELSPAQLMQKFLANAKPETKERMKGVSPAEFMKILGAIMDEEEGMGKAASVAARWLNRQGGLYKVALRQQQFLSLMSKGGSFGVVSAYGPFPKHQNQERNGQLVADLQRMGYRKFFPLKGQWEGVGEKSILIPNISPAHLFALGEKYGQDATIYKSRDGVVGMYYPKGHYAEVAVDPSASPAFAMAADKDLFSKDRNWSFEFGFLWGQKVPWDGRHPIGTKTVEELLNKGQLTF